MRERTVTRTIEKTTYIVMTVNLADNTIVDCTVQLPKIDGLSEKKINEAIAEKLPDNHKFVVVKSAETVEELYGMTEADFLKYAKRLPDRKTSDK